MTGLRSWDWYGDASLFLTDVPLACCALEVESAVPAAARQLTMADVPPGATHVVTITGTVSNRLATGVADVVSSATTAGAQPWVVAVGACVSGGGPYWDSYCVLKGADQVVPIDRYLPGCPPPPDALTAVLDELRRLGPRTGAATTPVATS